MNMNIAIHKCEFCKHNPSIIENTLFHKCKKLSVIISDSIALDNAINKWNLIQEQGTSKNILVDAQ